MGKVERMNKIMKTLILSGILFAIACLLIPDETGRVGVNINLPYKGVVVRE